MKNNVGHGNRKVLSEALIQVLDMEMELPDMRGKTEKTSIENNFKMPIQELAEETGRIVLAGIKELSGEGFMFQSIAVEQQGAEEIEQEQDEDVSEDMLAFAFGMENRRYRLGTKWKVEACVRYRV